eukprot:8546183-Alexandrium_andersonii.AAC.1
MAPIARGSPCGMVPGEASGASRAMISPPISSTRRSSVQSWRDAICNLHGDAQLDPDIEDEVG